MKYLIFVGLIFTLTGCTTGIYSQENLDIEDSASYSSIRTQSDTDHKFLLGLNEVVVITNIDEKNLYNISYQYSYPQQVNVAPGNHVMEVRFHYLNSIARGCLEFKSIGGENYILAKEARGYGVKFWLETESGEVTGNICGFQPLDEPGSNNL